MRFPIGFEQWPTDANELMIRLKFYWSRSTWLLIGLLIATPAHASERALRWSELAVVAGHAFDAASSQRCLGSGRCHETNAWLARYDDPIRFTAAKLTIAGVQLWATRKLAESGHARLAIVANVAIGSGFTALAVRNTKVGK